MLAIHDDGIEIIGLAEDGSEAVELINRTRPDVVFLDIQMPELTGFDVLDRIDYAPLVIFTTAYDRYALKAFDVYSVDYLLKPIDPDRLALAIEKLDRLAGGGTDALRDRLSQVLGELTRTRRSRIQVKVGDKTKLIALAEVVCFVASEKYVEVHTGAESHLITGSLARLEAELDPDDFVRVHRSAIVNVNFIDEIAKSVDGSYEVRMKDAKKTALPLSRRHKSRLDLK